MKWLLWLFLMWLALLSLPTLAATIFLLSAGVVTVYLIRDVVRMIRK